MKMSENAGYRWRYAGHAGCGMPYEQLLSPTGDIVCEITEPEDRCGSRDLAAVPEELNRLADALEKAERERDEALKLMAFREGYPPPDGEEAPRG